MPSPMRYPIRYAITAVFAALPLLFVSALTAQNRPVPNRIMQEVDASSTVALPGTTNPHAAVQYDVGQVAPDTKFSGITVYFKPSAQQQADEDALVKAQQTPGSGHYHQWLTPAQWASRFGMSGSDLAKVQSWLEQQGFSIDRVANSRNSISFSGSAAQVQSAFQTEIHRYNVNGEAHIANATAISVPAAFAGVIAGFRNLDDFRPKPFARFRTSPQSTVARPGFTSGQTGAFFLTPGDVATIYDISAAYNSGFTGTGQTIAIVGQSAIDATDIQNFQTAAGLTVKAPTLNLVPNTGASAIFTGDEAESDIDLEYSGGIAKGANIDFYYVGNDSNASVFDALEYVIDGDLAPIVSISYGNCESEFGQSEFTSLNGMLEEGAAQGQTILASSGDDGSTACYGNTDQTTAVQEALAVNFPASSQYVTGLGGTEFPASTETSQYWEQASGGSDIISSALYYIPETTWNDDTLSSQGLKPGNVDALSAGGGGISIYAPRPSWQMSLPGIPAGSFRLVPDVSLASSPEFPGYLYCSSDTMAWSSGQKASCSSSGFRDTTTQDLTVAGGTSFAAPIFAGMVALIAQKENSTGLGLINTTLYTLAANSATYASAFHDITSGSNACTAGATFCSTAGESGYSAMAGYDEATGLGSVNLFNLLSNWSGSSSTGTGSGSATFALAATGVTVSAAGGSGTSTVTITPSGGFTGTVDLSCAITASPSGATDVPTCSPGSSSVNITGTTAVTATVNIATTAATASAALRYPPPYSHPDPFHKYIVPAGGAALALVLFVGIPSRRRGWQAMLGLIVLVVSLAPLGCGNSASSAGTTSTTGSSGGGTGTSGGTTSGAYTVTVTGTSATTSSLKATATFTVTVN
jgi:subtilase family serine protease